LQRRLATTPTTTAREDADFLIEFINVALHPLQAGNSHVENSHLEN